MNVKQSMAIASWNRFAPFHMKVCHINVPNVKVQMNSLNVNNFPCATMDLKRVESLSKSNESYG